MLLTRADLEEFSLEEFSNLKKKNSNHLSDQTKVKTVNHHSLEKYVN